MAVVLHTMVGTLSSCDAEFQSSASQVSAHYGVGLDGAIHQYVALEDSAWANGILEAGNTWGPVFGNANPNRRTVSIETEDNGQPDTEPVTDAQFAAVESIIRLLVLPQYPTVTHLVAHHAITPQSRSCPAKRWLDSGRFDQLAAATGLTALK